MIEEKFIGWLRFKFYAWSDSGKTQIWIVKHKDDHTELGIIRWSGAWRQYIHAPASYTEFFRSCHNSINQFIDELMEERKV